MSNETKHTPGPWKVNQSSTRFELLGPDVFPILRINGGMVPIEANARLIAAAPELLDALKALVNCPDYKHIGTLEMVQAKAAIAKAEGRQ